MTLASIDETELQRRLEAGKRVVVDFHADWCPPCHLLAPELDRLASRVADDVEFVKVDVDENPGLALSLGIRTIPTVVLFAQDGEEIARSIGAVSAEVLSERLGLDR